MSDSDDKSWLKKILQAPFWLMRCFVGLLMDTTEFLERRMRAMTDWIRSKTESRDDYDVPVEQKSALARGWQRMHPSKILSVPVWILRSTFGWFIDAVEGTDRRFKRMIDRTDQLGQSVAQADSALLRFFRILWFPFVWIWIRVLTPLGSKLSLGPIFHRVGSATYWLWYPVAAFSSFLTTFLQTRSTGLVLWMVPLLSLIHI
jgi:hypothetical protein